MKEPNIIKISQAQLDSWEWKEKAYEEIKHLSLAEQMRIIHEQSKQTIALINEKKKSANLKNVGSDIVGL